MDNDFNNTIIPPNKNENFKINNSNKNKSNLNFPINEVITPKGKIASKYISKK